MSVQLNDTVKLLCRVRGQPKPNVVWFFNDIPVEPGERWVLLIFKFLKISAKCKSCELRLLHLYILVNIINFSAKSEVLLNFRSIDLKQTMAKIS